MNNPQALQPNSAFSIALLFYLVTLGAIVSACLRLPFGESTFTIEGVTRSLTFGVVIGMLVGSTLAAIYFKRWVALAFGLLAGILIGGIAGILVLSPPERFMEIVGIAFVGCWLILATMVFSARFLYRTEPTEADDLQ